MPLIHLLLPLGAAVAFLTYYTVSPWKPDAKISGYFEMLGFSFCEKIRTVVDCPILFLTAKVMETDIMNGLNLGGDDYITKPFGTGELRARVNAHLRREKREKHSILCASGARFDSSAKEVSVSSQVVPLTKSEYRSANFLPKIEDKSFQKTRFMKLFSAMTAKATRLP